jgi:hypothetical protein
MRAFFFQPFHLSSIQQGIQAGHAAVELVNKYPHNPAVNRWRKRDKTFIVKNGGDSNSVHGILKLFKSKKNIFPFAEFREPDLENILTSVVILLPKHIYEDRVASNAFEEELISLLKRTQLAK